MATQTLTREERLGRAEREHRYFLVAGLVILGIAFVGFAPSYYLVSWMHGRSGSGIPAEQILTPLVHLHSALFTAWVVLFIVQAALVGSHNLRFHRRVGPLGLALAVAMVGVGLQTTVRAAQLDHHPPQLPAAKFIVMPIFSIVLFAGFIAAGLLVRNRPAAHKRWMLLGTITLLAPAVARMHFGILPEGPVGTLVGSSLIAVLALLGDTLVQRRLHPVMAWGVGIMLASVPFRFWLIETSGWKSFAQWFIG